MGDIRVHIDTLEYTRSGLKTKEPINLQVGQHNRLVLVRPPRQPATLASYGGFPKASSFPGPAVLSLMRTVPVGENSGSIYQLFVHCREASEADGKTLTDRRGRAVRALLVADVDDGVAVSQAESWDDACAQVMLRALRCDPGPPDGQILEGSAAAIRQFQQRYADGVFHSEGPDAPSPRFESLAETRELDQDTREALVEAYLLAFSPRVDPGQLHPVAPVAGCGSFNLVVDQSESPLNDRVSLVTYPGLPDHPESAPCKEGDTGPCAVVDDARQRCMWFREHVHDRDPAGAQHEHFSPMWKRLPDGRYVLSALTTVPEDEEVVFEVHAALQPLDGSFSKPSGLLAPLSERLTTKPQRGIASVVWSPPPDFAPDPNGRFDFRGESAAPVFNISHPGSGSGRAANLYASYPRRAPASSVPAGVFGFDSSFPRPGIWTSLAGFPELLSGRVAGVVAFGHTDAVGSETYNKQLADRRAKAVANLVRSDLEGLAAIANEEAWDVDVYQAMLRAIGCDPGPPDGDAGDMTKAAIRAFQVGYPRGLFIPPDKPRASATLEPTGSLDQATKDALLEAYVHHLGLGLTNLPSVGRTFAGCGEFNHLCDDAAHNRRVTLAVFQEIPDDTFPCTEGEASRCTLYAEGGARRCSFYRDHVDEPDESPTVAEFFDDHWMPTPSLRGYMSALTSLPDDTPVKFTVFRSGPEKPAGSLSSFYGDTLPEGLEEVAVFEGRVLHGVAFATWEGDDVFHPFDTDTWFYPDSISPLPEDFDELCRSQEFLLAQIDQLRNGRRYRPPLFLVEGGGAWFLSRPPGRRVRGLELRNLPEAATGQRRLAAHPDGRFFELDPSDVEHRHDDTVSLLSAGPVRVEEGSR